MLTNTHTQTYSTQHNSNNKNMFNYLNIHIDIHTDTYSMTRRIQHISAYSLNIYK